MQHPRLAVIAACALLGGCNWFGVKPEPEVRYIPVPEGYLQECELPGAPGLTGDLSEAFVVAYQCAEQGNRDKRRIRELTAPED